MFGGFDIQLGSIDVENKLKNERNFEDSKSRPKLKTGGTLPTRCMTGESGQVSHRSKFLFIQS